jgi:hypothetical protein
MTNCILHTNGATNYGWMKCYVNGKRRLLHHQAWFLSTGEWPKMGWVDGKYWVTAHKCDNKACINPEHLENVGQSKNTQDAHNRGLHTITEETRRLRSIANLGKKVSNKTKSKIALSLTGRKHKDETRRKMSMSQSLRRARERGVS